MLFVFILETAVISCHHVHLTCDYVDMFSAKCMYLCFHGSCMYDIYRFV